MKNKKNIKILCKNTLPSRNTEFFINLTNLFNNNNLNCTLYGPDEWHIDKCNAKNIISDFKLEKRDIIIVNNIEITSTIDFLNIKKFFIYQPRVNKKIRHKIKNFIRYFYTHLRNIRHLSKINSCYFILSLQESKNYHRQHKLYDKIHIEQENKQKLNSKYFQCPTVFPVPNLVKQNSIKNDISIIQDISPENNIKHVIDYALKNYPTKNIILYGAITKPVYFYDEMTPILQQNQTVKYAGFVSIKEIYEKHANILINNQENKIEQLIVDKKLVSNMQEKEEVVLKIWNKIFNNE